MNAYDAITDETEPFQFQLDSRLLVLAEPATRSNLYRELLLRWGFALPDAVVLDDAASPLLEDPRPVNLLVHLFAPYSPVTRTLSQRTMVLLPGANPLCV